MIERSEPVIAYRLWKISPEGRLSTAFRNNGKWPWLKPYAAICDRTYEMMPYPGSLGPMARLLARTAPSLVPDHDAPHFDCICGLYGYKSIKCLSQTFSAYYAQTCVLGRVALWGKVTEHTDGYRAEYGYPQMLYYPEEVNSRITAVRAAAEKYGIDATPIPTEVQEAYAEWRTAKIKQDKEIARLREMEDKMYFDTLNPFRDSKGWIM